MAEPTDMIVPLLREMREEAKAFRAETGADFQAIRSRLERIEQAQTSYRQALAADTLLSRLLTGEWEERITSLEKQVAEIRSQNKR